MIESSVNFQRAFMFSGVYTAMVTPFSSDDIIDLNALSKLILRQVDSNVHGVVMFGSTGEFSTISADEYTSTLKFVRSLVPRDFKLIAGCSENSTSRAIKYAECAVLSGADCLMISIPSYNKPTQDGIYRHFEEIHNAVSIPILIYSVPGRTIVDISDDTIVELSKLKNIVGIKDASLNGIRPIVLASKVDKDGFAQLGGDDSTFLGFMAHGGNGCISVASNIEPRKILSIYDYCISNDYSSALFVHRTLLNLYTVLSVEANPIPVKYILSKLNICEHYMRLPMTSLSYKNRLHIDSLIL